MAQSVLKKFKIIIFIGFLNYQLQCNVETVTIKFTNLECRSYDKEYVEFEKCYLKVVGRGKIALQMHLLIHHTPIDNITVGIQVQTII